jgi:hypothetical protein
VAQVIAAKPLEGRPRVVIGIDPSAESSGVAAWGVGPDVLSCASIRAERVRLNRAGWTEANSIELVDAMIADREWIACVERSFGLRGQHAGRVTGSAPTFAEQHWLRVIDLLARSRAARAGLRYRKPLILRPRPQVWRGPLGLAVKGVGRSEDERRAWVKAQAVRRLQLMHGLHYDNHDVAEAVSIAEYGARIGVLGYALRKGKAPQRVWWTP